MRLRGPGPEHRRAHRGARQDGRHAGRSKDLRRRPRQRPAQRGLRQDPAGEQPGQRADAARGRAHGRARYLLRERRRARTPRWSSWRSDNGTLLMVSPDGVFETCGLIYQFLLRRRAGPERGAPLLRYPGPGLHRARGRLARAQAAPQAIGRRAGRHAPRHDRRLRGRDERGHPRRRRQPARPPSTDGQLDVDVVDRRRRHRRHRPGHDRGLVDGLGRGPRPGLRRGHGPAQHPAQRRPSARDLHAGLGHARELHHAAAPGGRRARRAALVAGRHRRACARTAAAAWWPAPRRPSACATARPAVLHHLCIDCTACIAACRHRRAHHAGRLRRAGRRRRACWPCPPRCWPASAGIAAAEVLAEALPQRLRRGAARSHGYEAALRAAVARSRRLRRGAAAGHLAGLPRRGEPHRAQVPGAAGAPGAAGLALGALQRDLGERDATFVVSCPGQRSELLAPAARQTSAAWSRRAWPASSSRRSSRPAAASRPPTTPSPPPRPRRRRRAARQRRRPTCSPCSSASRTAC